MKELKLIFLIIFSGCLFLTSSCESKSNSQNDLDKFVKQEKAVADFLIQTIQINSKLIAIAEHRKESNLPINYKQLFINQQQIAYSLNKEVEKIATIEMVSIPDFYNVKGEVEKLNLTKEQKLDNSIDNLILQVKLLRELEELSANKNIQNLASHYLPKLSIQLVKSNTFKTNKYLTN